MAHDVRKSEWNEGTAAGVRLVFFVCAMDERPKLPCWDIQPAKGRISLKPPRRHFGMSFAQFGIGVRVGYDEYNVYYAKIDPWYAV